MSLRRCVLIGITASLTYGLLTAYAYTLHNELAGR